MIRFLAASVATGIVSFAALAVAQEGASYKAPRFSDGVPDISGDWTNVTASPVARPAKYTTLVSSTADIEAIEGPERQRQIEGRKPVDPSLGAEDQSFKKCDGAGARDCGYDVGWKEPGLEVARVRGEPRTSLITYPANGQFPPLKDNAPKLPTPYAVPPGAERTDNPETAESTAGRCLTAFSGGSGPVMRPVLYNSNYKIVQSKDTVAIWIELMHDVRTVRIGGKHLPPHIRPWLGDSIGWYEGDTLVVETTNFHPAHTFPAAGHFGGEEQAPGIAARPSPDLKVTERFTRLGPDRLLYQFHVEDPQLFDEPWGGEWEWRPVASLYEYACHEGNYGLMNILAGAREEDRMAGASAGDARGRSSQ